jgi:DsbC/DsbD-like thiol-disulfide interchange protein
MLLPPHREFRLTMSKATLAWGAFTAAVSALLVCGSNFAYAEAPSTAWIEGFNYRVRLTAGEAKDAAGPGTFAFVEVEMPKGWKTYWRNPGDAGGIPPAFDWSGSANVKDARVVYPAPQRLTDKAGDTIGYKERAIFPARITAADPAQPMRLKVVMAFGVCEKICVPADATLELELPLSPLEAASADAAAALSAVPRRAPDLGAGDPKITTITQELSAARPRIVFDVADPGDKAKSDLFLEAPDGLYIPLPKMVPSAAEGTLQFEIDLSKDVDLKALKGKTLTLTAVGSKGQSEQTFAID